MLTFGVLSSFFDFATFGVLRLWVGASTAEFRTGWFVESVVSAALIVLVVRTRGRAWRSRPGRALALATVAVLLVTVLLPLTPLARPMSFAPLPLAFRAGRGRHRHALRRECRAGQGLLLRASPRARGRVFLSS
jgi:P-type Mg2+ transporter